MNKDLSKLIIPVNGFTIREALGYINTLAMPRIALFVADENKKVLGALTEGDIRRAILAGKNLDENIAQCMNKNFTALFLGKDNHNTFERAKQNGIRFLPLVNANGILEKIIDTEAYYGFLPFKAVLMAGGKGERLMPLTEKTPKPLLKVGEKAIIDYNIERLLKFGITSFHITLRHLGKQIEEHIQRNFGSQAEFVFYYETEPRGTAGSLSEVKTEPGDSLLFMNCDLLTNIDFASMYEKFISDKCELLVASIQYHVDLPYAVFEFKDDDAIRNLAEKPRYSYEANAGIYLLKTEMLNVVPQHGKYDATDLLAQLLKDGKNVKSFPLTGYWLDIGRPEDYTKAQHDIQYIHF